MLCTFPCSFNQANGLSHFAYPKINVDLTGDNGGDKDSAALPQLFFYAIVKPRLLIQNFLEYMWVCLAVGRGRGGMHGGVPPFMQMNIRRTLLLIYLEL